jgi:hypothetical protein
MLIEILFIVFFLLAKNCRILQFKLRKAEKRNENMENEKIVLEGEIFLNIFVAILNNYFSCNMKLIFIIACSFINICHLKRYILSIEQLSVLDL